MDPLFLNLHKGEFFVGCVLQSPRLGALSSGSSFGNGLVCLVRHGRHYDEIPCRFLFSIVLLQYHPMRKELSMSLIQPIKYLSKSLYRSACRYHRDLTPEQAMVNRYSHLLVSENGDDLLNAVK